MALLHCDFFSEALSLSTSMSVILPQQTVHQIGLGGRADGTAPPVLYLLHGLSDDHTAWVRRTSVERYAAPLGLAVVMPQVHRSYYTDEAYGGRFWTFLTTELPQLVQQFFRVSTERRDTFVAGLSMGGYGAFKWALREPGRFAAAASLSGALDIAGGRTGRFRAEDPRMFARIFGDTQVPGPADDLVGLVAGVDPAALPRLALWCGTEDALMGANRTFGAAAEAAGVELASHFGAGDHDWAYWDASIQDVLDWLPLADRP